ESSSGSSTESSDGDAMDLDDPPPSASDEDRLQSRIYAWLSKFPCTNRQFEELRKIFASLNQNIPSKKALKTAIVKSAQVEFESEDICRNGCISYRPPQLAELDKCPVCEAYRWKNKEKRKAVRTMERATVKSFVRAIAANHALSTSVFEKNQQAKKSNPSTPIADFCNADTAQLLFSGPSPLLSDHALVFSFNSDATDIPGVDKREANVQ
ncbi:hypothetical protein JCM5353_007442, partial [Sporobolomyces roseus]